MKKQKLMHLENIVKDILEKDNLARKDDSYLILKVIQRMYPNEVGKTFAEVMFGAKSKGISFESITRARRKVQNKYVKLRNEKISKIRNIEQEEYKSYAKDKETVQTLEKDCTVNRCKEEVQMI